MKRAFQSAKNLTKPLLLGALVSVGAALNPGCKKDEPPPPLPSAAPASTPSAPLELVVEDAGDDGDASDASDAKKPTGPYKPAASLSACCSALAQNAASAPPPTNAYMLSAAGICSSLVAQGKDKASIVSAVSGALKGAGMPAACR